MDQFYLQCWSIDTAQGYGLDAIGRKVGVNRTLTISAGDFLGFTGPDGSSGDSFDSAPFYSGEPTTANYQLTDDAYRNLILAKAAANITNGSIPAINQILLNLFAGRGNCYVADQPDGPMTMAYTFDFALQPYELAIVQNSNVLPTPAGVLATVVTP